MSSLPTPLRAALGIALTVVDTARETATHLPQKAAGLPVAVASQAVQLSLRAQQQYAAYVNKGDELIGTFRGAPEEPPGWATFDDEDATPARNTAFDRVPDAEDELDQLQAIDDLEGVAVDVADASLDLLDGSYELADGPKPTPGAPDTAAEADVTRDAGGTEVVGADAARPTTPREPARKATRKVATKASRKTAPAAAKKAAATTTPKPAKAAVGKKTAAAKTAAAKKATTATGDAATAGPAADGGSAADAAPTGPAGTTLEGAPLAEPTLPTSPDSQVSDSQPDDEAQL